jgi:hypothetical protein
MKVILFDELRKVIRDEESCAFEARPPSSTQRSSAKSPMVKRQVSRGKALQDPKKLALRSPRERAKQGREDRFLGGGDTYEASNASHTSVDALHSSFLEFNSVGNKANPEKMDGAHFMKLCKDCRLLGGSLVRTDVDLVFNKMKPQGQRTLGFEEFTEAVHELALLKGAKTHVKPRYFANHLVSRVT